MQIFSYTFILADGELETYKLDDSDVLMFCSSSDTPSL